MFLDREIDVFSAYYPITLFGNAYGIIFSMDQQDWFGQIKTRTLAIISGFLLMILVIVVIFVHLLTQSIKARKKVVKSEAQIRKILTILPAGVLIIDQSSRKVKFANPIAAKMALTTVDQMLGKVCHNFICPVEEGGCPVLDRGRFEENIERILLKSDGESVSILKTVKKLEYEEKPCLLESFIDITQRKRTELELVETNEYLKQQTTLAKNLAAQAETANRAKGDFLTNMSHEIRTPMNAVIGFNTLLEQTTLTLRQMDYVQKAGDATKNLLTIINDILNPKKESPDKTAPNHLDRIKVMVVDDHATAREVVVKLLQNCGFSREILTACSGEEALEIYKARIEVSRKIDLILMDFKMPGMNGIETWEEIKSLKGQSKPPKIIILTAYDKGDGLNLRGNGGIGDILMKPVTRSALLDSILNVFAHGPNLYNGARHKALDPYRPEIFDGPARVKILVAEDNKINQDLARGILEQKNFQVELADDGIEAIKKLTADQSNGQSYDLKGVAGNIGASDLFDIAAKLEMTLKSDSPDPAQIDALVGDTDSSFKTVMEGIKKITTSPSA